ncbi:MAG: SLBB domain-containing protein [Gemmatimonadaceae bacterium]|nr:SLBB domain-containing protein [Gemmatimonadaceae bacterium]
MTSAATAQARPSAAEAQALLQARPELVQQLRQRIVTSGMTAEQVRARLRAEGYPENLLDAYLPGSTTSPGMIGEDVLSAVQRLGIVPADETQLLRTMMGGDIPRAPMPLTSDSSGSRELPVYGRSLFAGTSSEFLPVFDGPVDPSYRLGPGDQLVLLLTGAVELAHTLEVTREGFVVIPQVGQLGVANLTLSQLEDLLYSRLARSYSGISRSANATTKFSVTVTRLRAIQVYVTGEVARPGSYRISSASTALTALYAAGGPTEQGSLREVVIRRGDSLVGRLDVYQYVLRGSQAGDLRLENGDVVFVRRRGPLVTVRGAVIRPSRFEMLVDENLRDAVAAAGGFSEDALTNRIQISRVVPPRERRGPSMARVVIDVDNPGVSAEAVPELPVEPGDEIVVFSLPARVRQSITVTGEVWTSGRQALTAGMRLSDALRSAGGLRPDAYLGTAHVVRRRADESQVLLRATLADSSGSVINDLELAEDDSVVVYTVSGFVPERYLAIGGAVKQPGRYPYRDGATVRDLVLLAGGLADGAYLASAEIARRPIPPSPDRSAITLRFALDSSYLVSGTEAAGAGPVPVRATADSSPVLAPFDHVLILREPDWSLPRTVLLTGEVRFPGRYTLNRKDERLADVVARAGGLTPEASTEAAVLTRLRAASAFSSQRAELDERARIGIDLAEALRRPSGPDNILALDGDELHVPERLYTVEIRGYVNSANAMTVSPGRNLGFYIRSAGGASREGDARHAYVIQPSGKIESRRHLLWLIPFDPTPLAGSTVVVPLRAERAPASERIATVGVIAQTLASIAAVVALLR